MPGSRFRAAPVTRDEALAECEATVRRVDPDRYFASLFAPVSVRRLLFALYAFHYEIVRTNEVAREPMMVEVRQQWWRDAVESARRGEPPQHPVALALAEAFARTSVQFELIEQLMNSYAPDRLPVLSASVSAFEEFAEATSATLMRLAASLIGDEVASMDTFGDAGIAYGLARILGALPFYGARSDLHAPAVANRAIQKLSLCARDHLHRARNGRVPRRVFAAIMPAALVPTYLASAVRIRDPLLTRVDISPLRRQLVLLRAAMFGRL